MPAKNIRQSAHDVSPIPTCPKCGTGLTFHNDRREQVTSGTWETVEVFLCIHHGFFRLSDSVPIKAGM